jgi:hydrogenase maturation protein HypF
MARGLRSLSEETGISKVVLSGGCFQNALFTEALLRELEALGLRGCLPERVPVNDGGVSYGQAAWVAYFGYSRTSAKRS